MSQTTNNFAGMNCYFLHAYEEPSRLEVLNAMQAAGAKILRIFISATYYNNKDSGSVLMPDVEPDKVRTYDDTQLKAIDKLMVEAQQRSIKLIIALHDRYALGYWSSDAYVKEYKLKAVNFNECLASENDVTWWYQDPSPVWDFDLRMKHIVNHRNELLGGKKWSELASHIFAFNIQNEGQGHLNNNIAPVPGWWRDRAKQMRNEMGKGPHVPLISTGGGNEFSNSDVDENWNCEEIDLVCIHSYDRFEVWEENLRRIQKKAQEKGKLFMVEEFGVKRGKLNFLEELIGVSKSKEGEMRKYIDVFNKLEIPWAVWQINKPGKGQYEYEFWTDEPAYYRAFWWGGVGGYPLRSPYK